MSFSFGGGGGFGFGQSQPAQSPFGGTATFGQTSAPFGQQQASLPFGASSSPGMFGASQPAFGAQSTPAFGASSTPAFGTGGFGTGGFGAGSSNPFGGASQPAFGAASTPAFGASTPAFGATGFGASTPAFGSTGFGAASTPAFGSASPAPFGSPSATPAFGSSTPAFGAGFGLGGGASFGGQGTRGVPYQKTAEQDPSTGSGPKTTIYYTSLCAMPAYSGRSHEELRWEDYQAGCKGNTGTASSGGAFGQTSGGLFGQTQASAPFGQASTPAFGAASTPAFGAASTPSLFGASSVPAQSGFGFGSTPAFGSTSTPAFGASSTPVFGQTAAAPFGSTAFGAGFGQSSVGSVFGQASTPSLVGSSTPAFGSTSSSFGAGGSIFGQSQASPGFGQPLGASSAASSSPFTFNTGGAFGASSTPSLFGSGLAFGQTSTPAFGQTGSSIFGQQASKPFGGGGLFGQQSTPGFGLGQSQSAFGTGSIFGQASSPAGALFGGQSTFNFSPQPGQQQQQAQQQLAPAQPLGVAISPYGALPTAPEVGTPPIPENRVGIAARPMSGLGPPRQTGFVAARSLTPRSGARLRPSLARRVSRLSASPADSLLEADSGTDVVSSPASSIFVMRDNPRQFFVRQPLPSTASAQSASPAPSKHTEEAPSASPAKSGPHAQPADGGPGEDGAGPSRSGKEAAANGDAAAEPRKPQKLQKPSTPSSGRLSDDQVAELLPKVTEDDYSIEPSLTQLAAMAREDPQSLAAVSSFKVSRRGIGCVRWLEPTDVRGLDVNGTVRLTRGVVEVYLEEADKPEVGEGLNRAAEITLHKVFRLDKATNRPVTDPADIEKYERKLKRVAAAQGARFISYDGKTGTWMFEVEHFSRYGLPDDSDDEDAPSKPEGMPADQEKAAGSEPGQEPEGEGMLLSDEDEDEGTVESLQGRERELFDGPMHTPEADHAQQLANSPVLHIALSARLGLDPSEMAQHRSDLFPSGGKAGLSTSRRKRAQSRSPATVPSGASDSRIARGVPVQPQEPDEAQPQPQAAPAALPAVTSWRKGPAAVQPPSGLEGSVLRMTESPAAGALILSSAGVRPHAKRAPPEALGLVDAGLMAGHSFRVGWAPGGRFAHPDSSTSARHAAPVAIAKVAFGEGVLPEDSSSGSNAEKEVAKRLRERCTAMLQIHKQHSSPRQRAIGAAGVTHQWAMQCSRKAELHGVVSELLGALKAHAIKVRGHIQGSVEELVASHQGQTWELVDVLFSHISVQGVQEEQDAMMEGVQAFCAEQEGPPAAAMRRAKLSSWFRDQASSRIEAALNGSGSEELQLAQLLTGQRLADAISLASASGDIRLAMLICQAVTRSEARDEVESQLALWQDAGLGGHMDSARMLVYELLAGHVNHVVPQMQLDWRRGLALQLWYGQSPAAPLEASLRAYEGAIQQGTAPAPLPLYMERRPPFHHLSRLEAAPVDVDYRLMELAAGGPTRADAPFLATGLSPLALSPDPLDYLFPWMLLQTLQAVGAIPEAASPQEVCAVHMSLISQLERLGGVEDWALYVALHLPDGADVPGGSARDDLVLQLLHRHAPVWAASQEKQEFLVNALGLPASWLATALATFASYNNDLEGEYKQRIAAGDWAAAHALFAEVLGPHWWLSGQQAKMRSRLQPLLRAAQEARVLVDPLQWATGAELYGTFFDLEDMYKARSPLYDSDSALATRMQAVDGLSRLLQRTEPPPEGADPDQKELNKQAVYSSMSKQLADWLLTDGPHSPEDIAERQKLSTGLRTLPEPSLMHHVQIAAAALGEVLAQ